MNHDNATAAPVEPSRKTITGWLLLIGFAPLGLWLLWEIQRTVGLDSPRLWELLREDRVFAFAMLDFFGTAAWAAVVLLERADPRSWRTWLSLLIFCAVPTLGIILFLLIGRTRPMGVFQQRPERSDLQS
ncbi:hypothetical protein AB1L88_17325 [Tautonia sp. JC769]|uniref:hypothetical protein n=1 Tax=Tautonia sp. JC769 TaxID=3232135 RepID=UPI00345899BC